MTIQEFRNSVSNPSPPNGISNLLSSLWYDGKGDWEKAHDIAQEIHTEEGSWIHAYLHRKEGDEWNAGYWYRKAGKPFCEKSLDQEWSDLVENFLT